MKLAMEMAKVINSDIRLIQDGFCFLNPLEEPSILGNMLFRSMSVLRNIVRDWAEKHVVIIQTIIKTNSGV